MESKRELGEHTERAERPHHQLRDVVPADGLHDLRAAPGHDAVGLNEPHAEQQVTQAAKPRSERTARVGRRDAAEGPCGDTRRIDRQPLAVRGEQGRQRAGRHSRLDRDGQVVRVVLDHPIETREIEYDVDPRRRVAELERATGPAWDDRQPGVLGERDHPAQLVDRRRTHHPARVEPIDDRGIVGADVVAHPVATGDRDEGFTDRARRDGHRGARSRRRRARAVVPDGIPRRRPGARAAACRDS